VTIEARQYRWLGAMAMVGFVIAVTPARLRSPEPSRAGVAIFGLKRIASAEVAYSASCGNGGYAISLDVLLTPAGAGHEAFLADEAVKDHDNSAMSPVFSLGPGLGSAEGPKDCLGRATRTAYYAAAVPGRLDRASSRAFAMNTDGVVWQMPAPTAPAEPFAAPATPIR
jgi:hypothetical protein